MNDPSGIWELLPNERDAVVAPQSGGCARHVLSQRVSFRIDADGAPRFTLDASSPSALRLLLDSTVTLIVERSGAPGEEVHMTGRLEPAEDDAYRLRIIRAYRVPASGEKQPIALP